MTKDIELENKADLKGQRNEQVARSFTECMRPPSQSNRGVLSSKGGMNGC